MGETSPAGVSWVLLDALNSGDVERIVALYEPSGVVALGSGRVAVGREAIAGAMTSLLRARPRFSLRTADTVTLDGRCVVTSSWVVATPLPGGGVDVTPLDVRLVLRRQADATWLIAEDRSDR